MACTGGRKSIKMQKILFGKYKFFLEIEKNFISFVDQTY